MPALPGVPKHLNNTSMTRRFPIKEIARQSGLSLATIDRALNNRPHVSPQTQARVAAAIRELEGQEAQIAARGQNLFVDILVEAPDRFSAAIRAATETTLPDLRFAVFRPRFHFAERLDVDETCAHLARFARRGSQGVLLKARNEAAVQDAVADLAARRIPVITLFTDVPAPGRLAHIGLDDAVAGRTAAWLMSRMLPATPSFVMATQGRRSFAGESARNAAFCDSLAALRPEVRVTRIIGGGGLPLETARQIEAALPPGRLGGVYSMGGGNAAMLEVLRGRGRAPSVFIAHDLDRENAALLAKRQIDVVLHHDLRRDLRQAFEVLGAHLGLCPAPAGPALAPPQILTPENPVPVGMIH